jgi:hypothetical protein
MTAEIELSCNSASLLLPLPIPRKPVGVFAPWQIEHRVLLDWRSLRQYVSSCASVASAFQVVSLAASFAPTDVCSLTLDRRPMRRLKVRWQLTQVFRRPKINPLGSTPQRNDAVWSSNLTMASRFLPQFTRVRTETRHVY